MEGGRGVGRDEGSGRVEGGWRGGCGPRPVYDELDRKPVVRGETTHHMNR